MIHLYRFKDLNIVLDIGSGAVHAVSDAVFDVLSKCGGKWEDSAESACHPDTVKSAHHCGRSEAIHRDEETLQEAVAEIEELIAAGMLFSPAPSEEEVSPEGRGAVIKAMCLHVAHDCNMRCAYCFADTGGFSGPRGLMPPGTGKAAIDFLLEQSGSRRNLEIDFFGGEPLMNFDVVKELVHYGRSREKEYSKHIRFTLTTNGLLLDDAKTAFINEHMDNVILSIDGRPGVNDRMRKTVNGDGAYAYIIDKLLHFVMARKKCDIAGSEDRARAESGSEAEAATLGKPPARSPLYYVRGTFTKYNKDFAEDVRHLAGLGFENISIEPVVTGAEEPWALTEDDLPELYAEYDRLASLVLESEQEDKESELACKEPGQAGNPISFFHFKVDLGQGPCVYKRASGCGAGTAYVAVTPEGDIYPCHQFAGEEAYKLGNVHEVAETGFKNRLYESFEKAHIFSKDECRECWAKYYCSGGCHANALHFEGSLMKPHRLSCALEKKRLECAIGLAAKRALAHY